MEQPLLGDGVDVMPSDLSEQQLLALLSSACCLSPVQREAVEAFLHFSQSKYHLLLFLISGTLGDPGDHLLVSRQPKC